MFAPKKIIVGLICSGMAFTTVPSEAGWWQSSKELYNDVAFWKNKHLSELSFSNVYNKALYKKSYFGVTVMAVVTVGAIGVSYVTAGAGAPAASAGVGTVATAIGGGGQGAYMAGLSTVGSWFGGNAVLGGAILNGISNGLLIGSAGKLGVSLGLTSAALDGVAIIDNPKTHEVIYHVKVKIPKNIGNKSVRDLVDEYYDFEEKAQDASEDKDLVAAKKYQSFKSNEIDSAISMLKTMLSSPVPKDDPKLNQENLLVLSIFAWNSAHDDLFSQAVVQLNKMNTDNDSEHNGFLQYLNALNSLAEGNKEKAIASLKKSIVENPYALEAPILYLNLLATDFEKNRTKIENLVKQTDESFDSDKYSTDYSMASVYYRAGTIFFLHKDYKKAEEYFNKAHDSLSFFEKHFLTNHLERVINIGIMNSQYLQDKIVDANELYKDTYSDADSPEEKASIKAQYLGNK